MRGECADARIGNPLRADRIARLGDLTQYAEQGAVRTGADQQTLPGRDDSAAFQPAQSRFLILLGAAEAW